MNKEVEKFLDIMTDNLVKNNQNNFEQSFKESIGQTATNFSKEELAEILCYILIDFAKAESEMNKEIEKHAIKSKNFKS
jgi:hypothetical protein